MKKVKGLVLESSEHYTRLLTRDGEYISLPARGQVHEVGSEIEMEMKSRRLPAGRMRRWGMAAAVVLVVGLLFMTSFLTESAPSAYLDLDVNPSLSLHLDREGRVEGVQPMNEDGDSVLRGAQGERGPMKGQAAEKALERVLEECLRQGHLSLEEVNAVFLSLAAPDDYLLDENGLEAFLREQILKMELDAYLQVSRFGLEAAEEARGKGVSLNAVGLRDRLREERQERPQDDPGPWKEGPGPPASVRDFLKNLPASEIFDRSDFVGGRKGQEERPGYEEKPADNGPPFEVPGKEGSDRGAENYEGKGSDEDAAGTPPPSPGHGTSETLSPEGGEDVPPSPEDGEGVFPSPEGPEEEGAIEGGAPPCQDKKSGGYDPAETSGHPPF